MTIGNVRTWQLGEGRAEARRLGVLIDQGQDPRAEAEAKEAAGRAWLAEERRSAVTLGDAWAPYIEARTPHWSAGTARAHGRLASPGGRPRLRGRGMTRPGPLTALISTKLADLTAEAITAWLVSRVGRS
jgi:hypothetical protein